MKEHDSKKVTPGGSTEVRHREHARDRKPAPTDHARAAAVVAHMARFVGPVTRVLHEAVSEFVHIDVHVVAPTAKRPVWTLFTTGMSDLPMSSKEGAPRRLELIISLPKEWKLDQAALEDERWSWPIQLLRTLARLPHEHQTWLSMDHTVPNGDPAKEYIPGVGFDGVILLPAMSLPEELVSFDAHGERHYMLGVYPLYADEMRTKVELTASYLMILLEAAGVTELLRVGRPSVALPGAPGSQETPAVSHGALAHRARLRTFIALAVTVQLLVPLTYYLRDDPFDERFAWRMFSGVRLQQCDTSATETRAGTVREVALYGALSPGWVASLQRNRRPVIERYLEHRCDLEGVTAVQLVNRCREVDGSTPPPIEYERDCASGASR